jgi:hypothetical protein
VVTVNLDPLFEFFTLAVCLAGMGWLFYRFVYISF